MFSVKTLQRWFDVYFVVSFALIPIAAPLMTLALSSGGFTVAPRNGINDVYLIHGAPLLCGFVMSVAVALAYRAGWIEVGNTGWQLRGPMIGTVLATSVLAARRIGVLWMFPVVLYRVWYSTPRGVFTATAISFGFKITEIEKPRPVAPSVLGQCVRASGRADALLWVLSVGWNVVLWVPAHFLHGVWWSQVGAAMIGGGLATALWVWRGRPRVAVT